MDKKDGYALSCVGEKLRTPAGRIIVGAKQIRKALSRGSVREVYLASDADPSVTQPIARMCAEHGIVPRWVPSKRRLGQLCGIDVGAAAAAVAD